MSRTNKESDKSNGLMVVSADGRWPFRFFFIIIIFSSGLNEFRISVAHVIPNVISPS